MKKEAKQEAPAAAGEADLLALPAVVLRPVPPVDAPAWMASARRHGGIPLQALEGLTDELDSLGLNVYPGLESSGITVHWEFVCTPGIFKTHSLLAPLAKALEFYVKATSVSSLSADFVDVMRLANGS